MEEMERSEKDLEKLKEIISFFRGQKFSKSYREQLVFAETYWKDAEHYHEKGDYFTSFGCANYAYGILEGIIMLEKGKTFHELGEGK
jgi:uncharacterized protein